MDHFQRRWALAHVAEGRKTVDVRLQRQHIGDVRQHRFGQLIPGGIAAARFWTPADRLQTAFTGLFNVAPTADLKRFLVPLPVAQPLAPAFTALVNWKPGTNPNSR